MRTVWTTGLIALALFAGLGWYLAPLEPGVVALQFASTPAAFAEVLSHWSAEDLLRYRRHLPVDFLLLVDYGLFGYSLVTRTRVLGASRGSLHRLAAWLLPLAALCDATENVLHLWLTAETRSGASSIYAASAGFSGLKWGVIVGFSALIAHALIRRRRP
jgi:hypothetical protein